MSQLPYTPNPKAVSCAEKVGLPSWYIQDPMLPRPQVVVDPEKIRAFNDCMQSSSSNGDSATNETRGNQTNSPTTWTPAKKGIVALLVVGTIYAILKHKKIIK